ncbi:MAG: NHLP bacteriocin export ABC transporter permease/ATPase subunit [Candidatus Dormibacteraeota bacterium]|nr:NHLP bacteriocin export ABC transporter permease/ATPase subunit [Candidatus Dormibacteraeota bacterium]
MTKTHAAGAGDRGHVVELAGNRPLPLDDQDAVWVVEVGQALVYAVRDADGQPGGARHHVLDVGPGQALFGLDLTGSDVRLLAVGVPGSRLVRTRRADFDMQLAQRSTAIDAIGRLEGWIGGLSSALPAGPSPRDIQSLDLASEPTLNSGEHVGSASVLTWVTLLEGKAQLVGAELVSLSPEDGWVPLAGGAWLTACGRVRLQVADTRQVIARGRLWTGLGVFHARALEILATRIEADEKSWAQRAAQREGADQAALTEGSEELLAAFEVSSAVPGGLAGVAADPILSVCRLVGRGLGLTIAPAPSSDVARGEFDRLAAIARASRIQIRQIALGADWWRRGADPLVGSAEGDGRPLALLPVRGGYEAVDPVAGIRSRVTAKTASSLRTVAYVLYRPFPDGRIGALDLLRFGLRGCGQDLLTVAIAGALVGLVGVAVPVATGILFDQVVPSSDRSGLVQIGLALLTGVVAIAAFQLARGIAVLRIEGKLDATLEAAVWDRLLSLPVPFFREYSSGDLAARAQGIGRIRRTLTGLVVTSMLGAIFSVFSYALLFFYDPRLALVATALLAVVLALTVLGARFQLRDERASSRARGRVAGLVLEFLTGISKIRVAGAERRAFAAWARLYAASQGRRTQEIGLRISVMYAALPLAALVVIFGAVALEGGNLSTGAFLAFNAALTQIIVAMVALGAAITAAVPIVPLYERVKPILQALPEVDLAKADPGELRGDIEMSHASFRYEADGPLILDQVAFRARPGEFVALVGPSGSGKSTILRLLLGFESPESGTIRLDGQDLATIDLRAVRRQIGVVLQNGRVMSGSIYTNIAGPGGYSPDQAWEAARMAGLDEDIRRMPMGMETVLQEGGGTISGGQRQRLMIARALISRPRILLFDEATSALDNQTQAVIRESLAGLQATRIVIAHRLSTIVSADTIHTLEAGRIVESGTYEELMRLGGAFAQLAQRQVL